MTFWHFGILASQRDDDRRLLFDPIKRDERIITFNLLENGTTASDTGGSGSGGHMNGRIQDAITGRFLSPDPFVPEPGNTQSSNRHSYVNDNPLSLVDPTQFDDDQPPLDPAYSCFN